MKEETINKLTEKALEYLNSAEAFVGSEVPKYVEELLTFKVFEHLFEAFGHLIVVAIFLYMVYKFKQVFFDKDGNDKTYNDRRSYSDPPAIVAFGLSSFVPIILSCVILGAIQTQLINAFKAYKAPRVYLIDYFTNKVGK